MLTLARKCITRRHFIQASGLLLLTPGFIGCSNSSAQLKLAGHVWPGYEFLFMAENLGWLAKEGFELIPTQSASDSMQALRDNEVNAAMLTLDEVIRLCSEGIPLTVVLVFNVSLGADVVISRPHIQSVADLKGAAIGYEDTALGALMLNKLLKHSQLTHQDVILKSYTVDQHAQAWQTDEIDVLITYEPDASILINQGAHRLFDSRALPDTIFDVLAVKSSVLKSQAKNIRNVIDQHFASLHHFRVNPMDASHRIGKRITLPPEQILNLYKGLFLPDPLANFNYLTDKNGRIRDVAAQLKDIMLAANIIDRPCQVDDLFTNKFIPRGWL